MKDIDTLVIGAGQAGLSMSYLLSDAGIEHLILEKERMLKSWRDQRWDSFSLVTPNWQINLPGKKYEGSDPDGFLTIDETIDFLEDYAARIDPPVNEGIEATAIEPASDSDDFLIKTSNGDYQAKNVVVAGGTFQQPKIPAYAQKITGDVAQIHSSEYRNPDQLPEGAVLVVGSGQSGCQIAEELHEAGRQVYLATGRATRLPRRYRGKDSMRWLVEMGFTERPVDKLESPEERFDPNPHVSGKNGGHTINLHQFCRDGIQLLGHMENASGTQLRFKPDLKQNLEAADQFANEFTKGVDKYIEKKGLDAPQEDRPEMRDGYGARILTMVDTESTGINSIVWATGFDFDFSWVDFPILDEYGYPKQNRGVTSQPGLYFLGLHWLHTLESGLLLGVGKDARHVMADIDTRH